MNLVLFAVFVALFVALTPSVLLRLPTNGSKITVAVVHGIIFALVWTIIYKPVMSMTRGWGLNFMEGMEDMEDKKKKEGMKEGKKNK